jgi:RNA polymerase sigma-70 factor (ECF subfamily)
LVSRATSSVWGSRFERDNGNVIRVRHTGRGREAVVSRRGKTERSKLQAADEDLVALSDEALVRFAAEGDRSAAAELVGRYQQKAYAMAYHFCSGRSEEADDCAQEAFLRALANLRTFRGRSSFSTWFYRILMNTCRDGRRRHQRWRRVFFFWRAGLRTAGSGGADPEEHADPREHADPAAALAGKDLARKVRKAMLSLPEKQRTVFQLKVFHGMTIHEIANIMDSAEGTVKSHLFRATQSLREALSDWVVPERRS